MDNKQEVIYWRVKKVLDKRYYQGMVEFLVLCKQKIENYTIWLPVQVLTNCHALINNFEKALKKRDRKKKADRNLLVKINKMVKQGKSCEYIQEAIDNIRRESQKNQIQDIEVIDIESDSKQEVEDFKEMKIVKRYDVMDGQWKLGLYSKDKAYNITRQRQLLALKEDLKGLKIIEIESQKQGVQFVTYERNNKRQKSQIQDFKFCYPQLLIDFILKKYDPIKHEVIKPNEKIRARPSIWSQLQKQLQ